MATTTSTTSTAAASTAAQTSAASIVKTLGSGSGIDTVALVDSLVSAQFATKTAQLTANADKLTAQISGVATLKSAITSFSSALTTLAKGGTLTTALTVSDPTVVKATSLGTKALAGFTGTLKVDQIAEAQSATTSAPGLKRATVMGTGTISIQFGTEAATTDGTRGAFTASGTPASIAITDADKTLDGIVAKINAANAGVTASIVTAANGDATVVVKGATGAASAFRITTAPDAAATAAAQAATDAGTTPAPGLTFLDTGGASGSAALSGTAKDAQLTLNGVSVTRASNTLTDLIDGSQIDLLASSAGKTITLGNAPPTAALSFAVGDVVDTYNSMLAILKEQTNVTTGVLARDSTATSLQRSLAGITLTKLVDNAPAGAPTTLAELGVSTNRDGTLSVDSAKLATQLAKWPAVVEQMFVAGKGLPAVLSTMSAKATDKTVGLDAATTRYTAAQTALTDDQAKVTTDSEALKTRLTQQYATMDSRVAAYKATAAFLTQQVDLWTKSTS